MISALEGPSKEVHSKLLLELYRLECPFTWCQSKDMNSSTITFVINNIKNKFEHEKEENFLYWYACNLVLAYELSKNATLSEALKLIKNLEIGLNSSINNNQDPLLRRAQNAFWHVLLGTKAYLYHMAKEFNQAEMILSTIWSYNVSDAPNKAAVWGIKSACQIEYGPSNEAIQYAEKALHIDNYAAEWHYLLGKSLSRNRRSQPVAMLMKPSVKEIESLEMANLLLNTHSAKAFLAQTYVEVGQFFKRQQSLRNFKKQAHRENKYLMEVYFCDAINLYREIFHMGDPSWFICWRCAHGLLRIPQPYIDTDLLKKFVAICIEVAFDKKHVEHMLCTYYMKIEKNNHLTLKYAESAAQKGVFGAAMDTISLRLKMFKHKDLIPLFDNYLEIFIYYPKKKEQILINKCLYMLFTQNDLYHGCQILMEITENNEECSVLQEDYFKIAVQRYTNERITSPLWLILLNKLEAELEKNGKQMDLERKQFFREFIEVIKNKKLNQR